MANNIKWGLDNPHPFSQIKMLSFGPKVGCDRHV